MNAANIVTILSELTGYRIVTRADYPMLRSMYEDYIAVIDLEMKARERYKLHGRVEDFEHWNEARRIMKMIAKCGEEIDQRGSY